MRNKWIFLLLNGIFSIVGVAMLLGGYFAPDGSLTDDGYPLNYFLYTMGGFFILFPLLLTLGISAAYKRVDNRINFLKTQGIQGTARVMRFNTTGMYLNRVPQLAMQLWVKTSLGEEYQARYKQCIHPIYYQYLAPDKDIPVYIDPADKNKLYLDVEQLWQDQAKHSNATSIQDLLSKN